MHGFLGLDGISPSALGATGRKQAENYGVLFVDAEVVMARRIGETTDGSRFELGLGGRPTVFARKLLLATGMTDILPDIPNLQTFYGRGVHHCPFCDGWEHRGRSIAAVGKASSIVKLALQLLAWSSEVTACTNGVCLPEADLQRLTESGIRVRMDRIVDLTGNNGRLARIVFDSSDIACDAIFFSSDQRQRSYLPQSLGCHCDDHGLLEVHGRQASGVPGVFVAGDAECDVQLAIVAAAEGAKAAIAIHHELQQEQLQNAMLSRVTMAGAASQGWAVNEHEPS